MDVSENSGTPKSSIVIGFSIINHPFWGTPIFGNTHMDPKGETSLAQSTVWLFKHLRPFSLTKIKIPLLLWMGFPKFAPIIEVGIRVIHKSRVRRAKDETHIPRCSMYGLFTYIWVVLGVNVGKYTIHWACGIVPTTLCKSLKNPLINPKPRSCKSDDLLCVFFFSPTAAFGQCKLPPLLYDILWVYNNAEVDEGFLNIQCLDLVCLWGYFWFHVANGCAVNDFCINWNYDICFWRDTGASDWPGNLPTFPKSCLTVVKYDVRFHNFRQLWHHGKHYPNNPCMVYLATFSSLFRKSPCGW